ncbi:MAG: DoxX family protein [Bacteroidota bacterium]
MIKSNTDYLPLLLRVSLGWVLIPQGFNMMMNYYDSLNWIGGALHLPLFLAYLVIVIEFYASLFLIVGLGGRIMAGAIALVVLAAIPYHFFSESSTDWTGQTIGQGIELHLLMVGTAIALMVTGSGKLSLDRAIQRFHW